MANNPQLDINREKLQNSLMLERIRANSEWCVACGASSSLTPDIPIVVQQEFSKNPELLGSLISTEFVSRLADKLSTPELNADWCVACGASSAVEPGSLVTNPVKLSDAEIDQIARRLLPTKT